MSLEAALVLLGLLAIVIGWQVAGVLWRVARKVARRTTNRLIDRAVDAVLFVLLFRWLKGKEQARSRPPVLTGDDMLAACPLSRWLGDPRACRWCNTLLPERRGRFCSPRCDRGYRRNHVFGGPGGAREAALERDHDTCIRGGCGATHSHARSLEVDHIERARGRHNEVSCIHHLDNLRTLCGAHHDEVTAVQRAGRWAS